MANNKRAICCHGMEVNRLRKHFCTLNMIGLLFCTIKPKIIEYINSSFAILALGCCWLLLRVEWEFRVS